MASQFPGLSTESPLFAGFTPFAKIRTPRGDLLVPSQVAQTLSSPPSISAQASSVPLRNPPQPAVEAPVQVTPAHRNELAAIALSSPTLFADLQALTKRVLTKRHLADLDGFARKVCVELFIGASLRVLMDDRNPSTWDEVLRFLDDADPGWDSPLQIVADLFNTHYDFYVFDRQMANFLFGMSVDELSVLLRRCRQVLRKAMDAATDKVHQEPKPRYARKSSGVAVFTQESIQRAFGTIAKMDEKVRAQAQHNLSAAAADDGYRALPDIRKATRNLDRLAADFENLAEPIKYLQTELALSGAMKPAEFRIAPMLLLGEPGIGKTYLASQLASALGVPMDKLSAGSAQGGFQLTGSHPSWIRAMPGLVFTVLANGTSATPVLVIDEVDKIGEGGGYPIVPALLDLLEINTAKTFKDEFFDMPVDASRIIVVLTANDLAAVPEPLRSRTAVFRIPRPDPVQRLRIIHLEVATLNKKTRRKLVLDGSAEDIANRADLDLRQTTRAVREAYSNALMQGDTKVTIASPSMEGQRQPMGFVR